MPPRFPVSSMKGRLRLLLSGAFWRDVLIQMILALIPSLTFLFGRRKWSNGYWVYSDKFRSWEFREYPSSWTPQQDHP